MFRRFGKGKSFRRGGTRRFRGTSRFRSGGMRLRPGIRRDLML